MRSLIDGLRDGEVVTVLGDLSDVAKHTNAQQRQWVTATLTGPEGCVAVQVPPATYRDTTVPIVDNAPAVVRGRVDLRGDTPILVAIQVIRPGGPLAANRNARRGTVEHPNRRLRRYRKGRPGGSRKGK